MAVAFVALATMALATTVAEQVAVLEMLSLGQQFAQAGADRAAQFEPLRSAVGARRNWAHYLQVLSSGVVLLVLYASLFRFAIVPRALAGFGVAAVLLQLWAVSRPIFGGAVNMSLLMPLGISQLALAAWLLLRGLRVEEPVPRTV